MYDMPYKSNSFMVRITLRQYDDRRIEYALCNDRTDYSYMKIM